MSLFDKLFGPPNIYKLKDKRDVKGLIKLLSSADDQQKRAIVGVLGDLGDSKAVEPLIQLLKTTDNRDLRLSALVALAETGDPRAADVFLDHLTSDDISFRSWAIQGFEKVQDPRSVKPILTCLTDKRNSGLLDSIEKALTRQGEGAISGLYDALNHHESKIRFRATQALAMMRSEEALDALIRALGHERKEVRSTVLDYPTAVGKPKAVPHIAKMLKDEGEEWYSASKALDVLSKLAKEGMETALLALLDLLADEKVPQSLRRNILGELTDIRDKRATEALLSALEDHDAGIREASVRALGRNPDPAIVEALSRVSTEDSDASVREAATEALNRIDVSPDLTVKLLLASRASTDRLDFEAFLKRVDRVYDKKMCWIMAAEALRQDGYNLAALQCYLELVAVDPLESVENVAWSWINGAWSGQYQKDWVKLTSPDPQVAAIFKQTAEFPRQKKASDDASKIKTLIDQLRGLIGQPGDDPKSTKLEIQRARTITDSQ